MVAFLTRLLLLFLIGFVQDALSASFFSYAKKNKITTAAIISVIHTAMANGVWIHLCSLIQTAGESLGGINLLAYCLGGGLGIWWGFKKQQEKKKAAIKTGLRVTCRFRASASKSGVA